MEISHPRGGPGPLERPGDPWASGRVVADSARANDNVPLRAGVATRFRVCGKRNYGCLSAERQLRSSLSIACEEMEDRSRIDLEGAV